MIVYRSRRRVPAGALWLLAIVFLAVLAVGAIWAWQASKPTPEAHVRSAVESISGQLDVLRISHYTEDTVRDGQVLREDEYQAALQDIELATREWESAAEYVPAEQAQQIRSGLSQLRSLVEQRASPEQVDQHVSTILSQLRGVRAE